MHAIVGEAVDLEREFCCNALSVALVGMNAELMAQVGRGRGPGQRGQRQQGRRAGWSQLEAAAWLALAGLSTFRAQR